MVSLFPIAKIDAKLINDLWHKILKEITDIGFDTVCDTVDGHSSNRKFYKEYLGNGQWRICIPHPYKEGAWIYLLFDQVHGFKCVYNNFINISVAKDFGSIFKA